MIPAGGRIYCVPGDAENVLSIDPEGRSTWTLGALPRGGDKWTAAVLAGDGKAPGRCRTPARSPSSPPPQRAKREGRGRIREGVIRKEGLRLSDLRGTLE